MRARLSQSVTSVVGWLPTGHRLSDARWQSRHRAMLWVLWLHLPGLGLLGLTGERSRGHVSAELTLLGLGAAVASMPAFGRRVRTVVAVVTLVSCSAVLVHLTDGLTESHFHFFAVVAFITLYQEWQAFAVAVTYVLAHHMILGVLHPTAVYSSETARAEPVLWAFLHAGFVVLASLASLAAWRLAEREREVVERVLDAADDGIYGVDASGRIIFVNPTLCDLLGRDRGSLEGAGHHEAMGHLLPDGVSVGRSECPLCAVVDRGEPLDAGEACLQGSGEVVPIEFVIRPTLARSDAHGSVVTVRDLRDRLALEAERRTIETQRDQLASIVEASPDVALLGRSDGRFVWMNQAGMTLLGFDESVAIGDHRIEDMFSAQEMARVYAEDMPVLAREGDWQGEWTLQARDGTQIPAWVTHHLHPDHAGGPAYVSGVMRDLRRQRQEDLERRENERRLAAAEGVAGLGSWEWELGTDKVIWSQGMYRLHGMESDNGEESFETWSSTVHPDDRAWALAKAGQARDGITVLDFTYRAVRADGRELVIHSRGEPTNGGRSVIGTLLDITDRHAAAEALRESEDKARSIIATAGDAYLQFGPDGLVTGWNEQAERTFGWSTEEACGQALQLLVVAPVDREWFAQRVAPMVGADGSTVQERFEMIMLHRSGREIPVEVTAWTTRSGDAPVYSCFVRDIAERLAAERAKNEFVSVVSHELRTPLTSIHGALGLLRAGLLGDLSQRGQQMVDIAVRNTDRLVRLINDILDIERLSSGKASLEREECDIAALATQSVQAMRAMAETSGVCLEVDAREASAWVDCDRIEQTLTNLLNNAIKFSPSGESVSVTTRLDGDEVRVEVRDRGRGIPVEELELIFDRFHQVDGSDAREQGGTGLGLAICRTIVEQHGGRIWAESRAGGGATVTFTVPVASPHPVEPGRVGGPRVLIYDDSADDTLATLLRLHGYDPIVVGGSLVDAAVESRPAVILMGLRTTATGGWESAAALRDLTETRDIPVVALSLHGGQRRHAVADQGADPPEIESFIDAVEMAISSAVGSTLLLVEDDHDLADTLTERFHRLGINVHHAASGQRALEVCAEVVPDLLVLDLLLPDQAGYAVVARMRRDRRLRGMPLVVYTACDLPTTEQEQVRPGETRVVTTGRASPTELERCVIDLLHHLTTPAEDHAHV